MSPPPSPLFKCLLLWSGWLIAGAALAAPPEKGSANSAPITLQYTSAIASYRPYTDQAVQSWYNANDRVGQIGGWRAYAKEAAMGAAAPVPVDPHAGHHGEAQR
ncbi:MULTISPECIES: hypothetical protein [Giesbergeria]|uniref:Uncharacterized protein n=1 Tax=Giesbergeria sinuosa TaxID=80883 RepID=A0ABV9QBK3_9BURK